MQICSCRCSFSEMDTVTYFLFMLVNSFGEHRAVTMLLQCSWFWHGCPGSSSFISVAFSFSSILLCQDTVLDWFNIKKERDQNFLGLESPNLHTIVHRTLELKFFILNYEFFFLLTFAKEMLYIYLSGITLISSSDHNHILK